MLIPADCQVYEDRNTIDYLTECYNSAVCCVVVRLSSHQFRIRTRKLTCRRSEVQYKSLTSAGVIFYI
jgi:hypothetical protein